MTECEELFGHNYGKATDDPFWDCIHVLAPGEREMTLCGKSVADVAQACSLDCGRKLGAGNGCWTCLSECRVGKGKVA
ncbi:MAG: hypothetical protein LC798_12950 [Chloroflexi bacterium]|nr:hypothetical protein [Chloroflexota bacterium]